MLRYYQGKVKTLLPFFGIDEDSPLINEKWMVKGKNLIYKFEFVENTVQIRLNFNKISKKDIKISVLFYDYISGESKTVYNFILDTDKVKGDYSYLTSVCTCINWLLDSHIGNIKPCEF